MEDEFMDNDEITEIEIVRRCEHTIELENLSDSEIVPHTILLIRGNIKPMCGHKKSIYIQQLEIAPTLKTAIVQMSSRGEFRILVDCIHYDNIRYPREVKIAFKIKYCDAERDVNFIYRTHECIYRVQPLYIVCHNDDENKSKAMTKQKGIKKKNNDDLSSSTEEIDDTDTTDDDDYDEEHDENEDEEDLFLMKATNLENNATTAKKVKHTANYNSETFNNDNQLNSEGLQTDAANSNETDEKNYENVLITDNALDIIDLNMRLVQGIYGDVLRTAVTERRTFKINGNCELFYSELSCTKAWEMTEEELWQYFAKELLESEYGLDDKLKFVAFIGCTKYEGTDLFKSSDFSYANIKRHLKAHAALGAGGLALFGTAHFYAWPRYFGDIISCFSNDAKINQAIEPDESNYRRTYGGVYASTLGALCHEIGHIFELGHTINGIMGSGLDYVNRLFTVDNLTELLPDRMLVKGVLEAPPKLHTEEIVRPRLTQIKRGNSNAFLEKYRQQSCRAQNLFYFTNSCSVILCYHPWFNTLEPKQQNAIAEGDPKISFDHVTCSVTAKEPHSLKLIEVRCNLNSLVTEFFEFRNSFGEPAVFCVHLPTKVHHLVVLTKTHHLFVITTTGHMKKLHS